jgi:hypothetical protein
MKKILFVSAIAVASLVSFYACQSKPAKDVVNEQNKGKKVVYTCSMHPEVESNEPGNCPKCGMKLIEKEAAVADSVK